MSSEKHLLDNQSAVQANFDAKKYLCGPWLRGARGGPWNLVFKPSFENAMRTQTDSFSSLHDHFISETGVGAANGIAHPAGQGMQALGMQSQMAYNVRNQKAYGHILEHVGYDQDIKDQIMGHVARVLTGAPTAAAATAANAAIAAANAANIAAAAAGAALVAVPAAAVGVAGQLPVDWLAQLWRWIDSDLGQPRQSGLLTATQNTQFENSKLIDVGITRDTPTRYFSALTRINLQRSVPKSLVDMHVKFMSQFTFPPIIHQKCVMELQRPSITIAAGLPNAGQPDTPAIVKELQELWEVCFDTPGMIKSQAAPRPGPTESTRVDGMMSAIVPATSAQDYTWTGLSDSELHEAYVVAAGPEAFAFIKNERNCWVCKGYGHTKDKCPSDSRVKRPIAGVIQGLTALQSAEQSRLRYSRPRRVVVRRNGRSPMQTATAREAAALQTDEVVIEYADGGTFTEQGEMISPPCRDVDEQPPAPDIAEQPPASSALPEQATAVSHTAFTSPTADNPNDTATKPTNDQPKSNPLDEIEKDFQSTYNNISGYNAETTGQQDPFIYHESPRWSTSKAIGFGILTATFGALGVAALAARSARGRAIITLLSIAACGQSCTVAPGAVMAGAQVHTSQFSRYTCYDAPTSRDSRAPVPVAPRARKHGTMDTGTTECVSGRRKLFPDALIEVWHPGVKVEVASGVAVPVLFRGSMIMKLQRPGSTSTKKTVTIPVPHSLHVPEIPVTLVSTKALLRYCGIRTYFNDELCMVLPNGTLLEFVETPTNYTVFFADDDESLVTVIRKPNKTAWPWVNPTSETKTVGPPALAASARMTLREPLPITWDLVHDRCAHFNPERIWDSVPYVTGLDIAKLGAPPHARKPCIHCITGAFRGHRRGKRDPAKYTRFGQRIYSDSCAMPKSTPFGYVEMFIFLDAHAKYIAVYFGKTTQAWEMLLAHRTFVADHKQWLPKGSIEEWFNDGGPEFKTSDTEKYCAEMHTRRRFIAPWNPWQNVSETGWRIILRPLRIILASANVTKALWPFAVNAIVFVHNALSSASHEAPAPHDVAAQALAFIASLTPRHPPPSPYFLVTGKRCDLSHLRVLFCEVHVRIRNKDDQRERDKIDPLTMVGVFLGPSQRYSGAYVYLTEKHRFTVASYNDIVFCEDKRPFLDRIIGHYEFPDGVGALPSREQQVADTGGVDPPELTLPVQPQPPTVATDVDHAGPVAPAPRRPNQCLHPDCTLDRGHDGAHSHELQAALRPRRPGLTLRDRTRADAASMEGPPPVSSLRHRDTSNVLAAVEGHPSIFSAAGLREAFPVAIAGDGTDSVVVCYNMEAPESLYDPECEPPKSTREALEGPNAAEWRTAYDKDLAAKIKNGTFKYVRRPPPPTRVLGTKVAHAYKHDDPSNSAIITERRARWVGLGYLQGPGDFSKTYCATPAACSVRLLLALVVTLGLSLAKGDVTKAFTLNPIDVTLFVEQMPGTEVAGDFPGATKENTVCLLMKCLEGLKQAGNVWQTTHSAFLSGLVLLGCCMLTQSEIEPCLFIGHCSKGFIAILVWVDDLLIAFSSRVIYDDFIKLYRARFPSTHELGCPKFAGLTIAHHHQSGSIVIHQRPHIEHAYLKFITDKKAAAQSSAVHRPAVADTNSPLHYAKLGLAANDAERASMAGVPYLAVLATLMYLTFFTNPHLAYHTSFLGQFMHDPSPACWEAVLSLCIYMYHQREHDVIVYGGAPSIPAAIPSRRRQDFIDTHGFHTYCDASWRLRSPAGFLIFLANGPIDWGARLVRVICHSSAEAEIAAGCMAGKRMIFIIQLLGDFKVKLKGPSMMLIDNSATDDLCNKFGVTPKTAHFLRWQHFLRWLVVHHWAEIIFVDTKNQLADIMTKVVDYSTFIKACRIIFRNRK